MGDLFDLSGKVALITGGNSGIGLGMAEGLASQGADVAIWGTNEDKNRAALEQLERHGTKVLALKCDVGDEAQVESSFAETVGALGKVDSCFANAGIGGGGHRFIDIPTEDWHRVLRVDLDGVFFTLRARDPPHGGTRRGRERRGHLVGVDLDGRPPQPGLRLSKGRDHRHDEGPRGGVRG